MVFVCYKHSPLVNIYKHSYYVISMKENKTLYLEKTDIEKWEEFCKKHFKTEKVLSKIVTEAMAQYMENY